MRYVMLKLVANGRGGPAEVQGVTFGIANGTLIQERNVYMKCARVEYVADNRESGWDYDPIDEVIGILKFPKGHAAYAFLDSTVVLCNENTQEFQKLAHLEFPVVTEQDAIDFIGKTYPNMGEELWNLG